VTRSIPSYLSKIIQHLELEKPELVTRGYLGGLIKEFDVKVPVDRVIQKLSAEGWLLRTGVQGVWEFAPAERAGPFSIGSPFLQLRALLKKKPGMPVCVALSSAMWLHDFADRLPSKVEVSLPHNEYAPVVLKRHYRIVRYEARLKPTMINEVPVHPYESVLVHLVHKPTDVGDWGGVFDWLNSLVGAVEEERVLEELKVRPHATQIRFAYLLSGLAPNLVDRMDIEPAGKVWFGPRGKLKRHNAKWNVADTILPLDPMELG
jgi:predicted transcriptional regulator of viral defense system